MAEVDDSVSAHRDEVLHGADAAGLGKLIALLRWETKLRQARNDYLAIQRAKASLAQAH